MGLKAVFVDFDFMDDFEERDGKVLTHEGTNRCIVKARSAKGALAPGTCHWSEPYEGEREKGDRCLAFVCPCGCGEHDFVIASLRNPNEGNRAWQWDGNLEKPTLSPSILRRGAKCQWHCFLHGGEWANA